MIDDVSILLSTIMCVIVIWRARRLDRRRPPITVPGQADPDAIFSPASWRQGEGMPAGGDTRATGPG